MPALLLRFFVRELLRLAFGFFWPAVRDLGVAPGIAIGLLVAVNASLGTWAVEWLPVAALLVLSAWAVRVGSFWQRWLPWLPRKETAFTVLLDACRSLFMLTATFAAVTAVLHAHGWLTATPPGDDQSSVWTVLAYYGWSFLDSVPVLEIPKTLNWSLTTTFTDQASGALLLTYKLLVIVPVVGVVVELIQRRRRDEATRREHNDAWPTGRDL
jgi:hypothetical protein